MCEIAAIKARKIGLSQRSNRENCSMTSGGMTLMSMMTAHVVDLAGAEAEVRIFELHFTSRSVSTAL